MNEKLSFKDSFHLSAKSSECETQTAESISAYPAAVVSSTRQGGDVKNHINKGRTCLVILQELLKSVSQNCTAHSPFMHCSVFIT